ncbi:MAG TPA: OmpA family protein [Sphingorhabdus sp.]|jgi:outer membrane protein OmpA-like peptidoglycan-associated protein|nr:OmpA family protein [Sphingorhabdus sp.]
MKRSLVTVILGGAALSVGLPAHAQQVDLTSMEVRELRPEVQRRYDEALAATTNPAVLASLGSNYTYASEAKVWCGIALGFLKQPIRDRESLTRCEKYHRLMNGPAPAVPVAAMPEPPAPRPRTAACDSPLAATLFFDWDSVVLPANADETLAFVTENKAACGWNSFTVVGHTDRSGSDGYNDNLSRRRAEAVAARLQATGLSASALTVSGRGESEPKVATADGERNPTNRRVEVTASN